MTPRLAWLSDLFPRQASPDDEAALDQHLTDLSVFYAVRTGVVLNILHLLFWPTDRWLLPSDPVIQDAMHWFRMTTFTNHTVFVLALHWPRLHRYGPQLFALGILISSALLGSAMARLGGLDQPYFYLTCLAPMGVAAMPARLSTRLLLSPASGLALVLAFVLTRPAEIHSTRFGSAVGAMAFAVAISLAIGHGMFLLTRRAILSERALARNNEHLEERVAAAAAELRALAAHQTRVTEEERARLSRELHDELGQQVTALRYNLAAARRGDPADLWLRLEDLEDGLGQLTESLRHLVTDLRPRILDDRGLAAAVQWLVARTAARTGVPCELSLNAPGEGDEVAIVTVPAEPAVAVFRIVQESLTNVLRHAQATKIAVTLTQSRDQVAASISDDGRGMPAVPTRVGMGLIGMRERARALGGELSITSRPGEGTNVQVRLPLRCPAA
mgnify:CR=1 FL=1